MTINQINSIPNPHDTLIEQAVLGAMLIDKKWGITAISELTASDFYSDAHASIFNGIRALLEVKHEVDVLAVWDIVKVKNELTSLGGSAYLLQLPKDVPPAADIEHYVSKIKQLARLREIIRIAENTISRAKTCDANFTELLDSTQVELTNLAKKIENKNINHVKDVVQHTTEIIQKLKNHERYVAGFPTGFMDFDDMTAGLQAGNLVIIAGRPSMGKTAFCLNMASNMAEGHKLPVLFISLEMGQHEIGFRLIAGETKTNLQQLKQGSIDDNKFEYITESVRKISGSPLYFDFSTSPDISEVRATARRWNYEMEKEGQKLAGIFVDYLQLIHAKNGNNREQEISYISRSLKGLARELSVPVIALSQLNRKPEERGRQGIPQLADLRESGALEQDADVVCALYRPIVYTKDEKDKGRAKLIVMKQRNGPIGDIYLTFNENYATFSSTPKKVEYEI